MKARASADRAALCDCAHCVPVKNDFVLRFIRTKKREQVQIERRQTENIFEHFSLDETRPRHRSRRQSEEIFTQQIEMPIHISPERIYGERIEAKDIQWMQM